MLAQVRALEVGMGNLGAAAIAVAGSGLRIGELLGLDVSDVDFLRRSIRVQGPRAQSGQGVLPTSRSSARTVPVGRTVIDAVAAYLKAVDRKWGPLFVNALGRPLKYRQWKPRWKVGPDKALRRCADRWESVGQGGADSPAACLAVVTPRTCARLWPVATAAPGLSSAPSSALVRTRCALTRCSDCACAGHSPRRLMLPSWSPWWPRSAVPVGI
jgi:hypothetical protein